MTGDTLRIHATAFLDTLEKTACPDESIGYREAYPGERNDAFLRSLGGLPKHGPNLEFRETLGEGAMGIVRLALQPSVGREVAVKSLRDSLKATSNAEGEALPLMAKRLLEEAWITGAIEHPNIVPIYDIGREEDGNPLIVMRRIAGRSWHSLLADQAAKRKSGEDAWVESHLRTLIQVANAVAAAHAQGIVHRDLKPDNVMLGQYGEVYVVDWGIAVLVDPARHAHLPILGTERFVVGTPCYMAPEMLAGDAMRSTDVYLLGAIAFEIVTGAAPHDQGTMAQAIDSILATPPTMPEGIDDALASLLCHALAREPRERPQSAADFADALERYLTTRASVQTARIGLLELDELERLTQSGSGVASAQVEGLFSAARFSFQTALRQWSGNDVAKSGLTKVHLAVGDYALRNDDPDHALAIAKSAPEFAQEDPKIRALTKKAENAALVRRRRMDSLARRGDVEGGLRTRSFLSSVVAFWWLGCSAISWWHLRSVGTPYRYEIAVAASVQVVVWIFLTRWSNRTMEKTDFNKSVARIGFAVPAFLVALALFLDQVGYRETEVFNACVVALSSFMVAITIFVGKSAYILSTLVLCLSGLAVIRWPAWRHAGMFAAATGAFVVSAAVSARAKWAHRRAVSIRPPAI